MAVFPRPSSPRAVWRDLRNFLAQGNRHKYLFATMSVALPVLIILAFLHDSKRETPPPQMWFVPSWPADRSDAVIVAQNKADQVKKDKLLAKKQAEFKKLANQLGIE